MLEVSRNGTGLRTRTEKVGLGLDLYVSIVVSIVISLYDRISENPSVGREWAVWAIDIRSSFLKPSRTLGELAECPASFSGVGLDEASPAIVLMVTDHTIAFEDHTADNRVGESAPG